MSARWVRRHDGGGVGQRFALWRPGVGEELSLIEPREIGSVVDGGEPSRRLMHGIVPIGVAPVEWKAGRPGNVHHVLAILLDPFCRREAPFVCHARTKRTAHSRLKGKHVTDACAKVR